MTQLCYKIRNSPAMFYDKVYVTRGPRLGKSQQCNKTVYSQCSRLGTSQQRNKIKNASAMLYNGEQLSNVSRWGAFQQCKNTGYTSAVF